MSVYEEYIVRVYKNRTEWRNAKNQLHRLDGPAIEFANGDRFWYQNDELHRLDGPAVEYANGTKFWYQNGQFHRLDGPAVEYTNGTKEWYQNGKCHRLDGPAYESVDGTKEWYIDGESLTEQEFVQRTAQSANDCNGRIVIIDGKKYQLMKVSTNAS